MRYAHFNAQRTSVNAPVGAISTSTANGMSQISDSSRPHSEYYNRAVVHPTVTTVVDLLPDLPASVQAIELLYPQQTRENYAALLGAGFVPDTSLCYLTTEPDHTRATACDVRQLRTDQRFFFFDLFELSGASFPQEKRMATHRFYCTEQFRCFAAYDSVGQPAGWATMYIDGQTGFLANAFTLPEHRRNGIHTALLNARIHLAGRLNLTRVFTDVEPASQSHQNCERCGFRLLSVNSIWKRLPQEPTPIP